MCPHPGRLRLAEPGARDHNNHAVTGISPPLPPPHTQWRMNGLYQEERMSWSLEKPPAMTLSSLALRRAANASNPGRASKAA